MGRLTEHLGGGGLVERQAQLGALQQPTRQTAEATKERATATAAFALACVRACSEALLVKAQFEAWTHLLNLIYMHDRATKAWYRDLAANRASMAGENYTITGEAL